MASEEGGREGNLKRGRGNLAGKRGIVGEIENRRKGQRERVERREGKGRRGRDCEG